jgi:riboflavin kinase / FMN adenylyltransferase
MFRIQRPIGHPVDLETLSTRRPAKGCVVTVGNFDGVHRGHRALLSAAKERAVRRGVPLVAITFEPHTRHFLDSTGGPPLLSTWCEREGLLARYGADQVVTLRFDDHVRTLTSTEFIDLLVDDLGAVELLLGFDHRFGRGGTGTAEAITPHCQERGLALSVVGAHSHDGSVVSSTLIRQAMGEWGSFERGVDLLGHPWVLLGEVVRGDGRGRQIGFPTANLEPLNPRKLLPASGVYAGKLKWADSTHPAVVNIGTAPTFQRGIRVVEVHVPQGPGPDYGQICQLDLYFQLRQECRFESLDALRAQIGRDAETAREKIAGLP